MEKIFRENAFEQQKKKLGLRFNPWLALISLRTAGPRISVTILAKFLVWSPRRNFCPDPCKGPPPRFSPRSPQDSRQEVSHCFSLFPRFGPVYHDKGSPSRFSPRSSRDSRQEVSHCFSPYSRFGPINHDFSIYLLW